MIDIVEFGEVYICVFPFTSAQGGKPRPSLVLRDLGQDCLICRITSVPHRGFLDAEIVDWRQAGLERPSTVRLSRLVTIEKSLLKVCIGILSMQDAENIRVLWNDQFRL